MNNSFDTRQHAADPARRLAEEALRDRVEGGDWTFVAPQPVWAGSARLSLRARPDMDSAQVTEALPGEALERLWTGTGVGGQDWVRVRTRRDGYLGWVPEGTLLDRAPQGEALEVTALRAHAFAGPKVSRPVVGELCLGARVWRAAGEVVTEEHRRWVPVRLAGGEAAWVQEVAFAPLAVMDPADFALRLLETPYVWGGRSAWGLDCSGLSGLAYAACGRDLPRDADQQQAALAAVEAPERGDLVFFPGHVGIMLDGRRLVHANATHMRVTVETLGEGEYGERLRASCAGFGRWTA